MAETRVEISLRPPIKEDLVEKRRCHLSLNHRSCCLPPRVGSAIKQTELTGKTIVPKGINEVKLISSGKILENSKTVGQCKTPFGEVAGGVTVMHVVVQPSLAKTKTGVFVLLSVWRIRQKRPKRRRASGSNRSA